MKIIKVESFFIVGVSVRTTNENQQAANDIPKLWGRFFAENIMEKIPNKIDRTIYCVYTGYEKDHTKPYTTVLGCKVENLDNVPDGFVGIVIQKGSYHTFTASGKLSDGITVFKKWVEIWNTNLKRTFTTDFEVYGEKANDPDNAEMDIFVAIE